MDRPDGASETEHPSSTPKVTVKIGSTTVKGVSTKKPRLVLLLLLHLSR